MAAISGAGFPGGEHVTQTTPTAIDASDSRSCKSIALLSESSVVYWGYDDMTVGYKRRGFISGGGSVSIPGPIRPDSLFVYGTSGNVIYWSGIPA
jgi:hypothetical protein